MSQEIDHARLAKDIAVAMNEVNAEGKGQVSELLKHAGTVAVVLVPIGTFILGLNSDIIVMREVQKSLLAYKSTTAVQLASLKHMAVEQENVTSELKTDIDSLFKGQSTINRKIRVIVEGK